MHYDPNRRWKYIEPRDPEKDDWSAVEFVLREQDIVSAYFPWWQDQMIKAGKSGEISLENCVMDFVVVNWAEEVR